ncbi:putative porin [Thalassotalea mangrovi]|uniref:Putative porin n=1 Tax=Thalassotalea mangrovi TaxID=2572245 RepID=A0A4U1B4G1_9GAMM|nr:putative porin [Thalassotalea mangrovi]TKB44355.1 putative porin [Thalassotalea mangrovi]
MRQLNPGVLLLAGMSALVAVVHADDSISQQVDGFQHQVDYRYGLNDSDSQDHALSYRYYLDEVQFTGPIALTNELAQTSYIQAGFIRQEPDSFSWTYPKTDTYTVSGEWIFEQNWFIGGQYNHYDLENRDVGGYQLSAGYYLTETTRFFVSYDYADDDGYQQSFFYRDQPEESASFGQWLMYYPSPIYAANLPTSNRVPGSIQVGLFQENEAPKGSLESTIFTLGGSHYLPFAENQGLYLSGYYKKYDIEAKGNALLQHYVDFSADEILLQADWFITERWNIGAKYNRIDFDVIDESEYSANTTYTYEFSNGLYIGAGYQYFIEASANLFNLRLGWRF